MKPLTLVVTVVSLGLVACGGDDNRPASTPTSPTSPAVTSTRVIALAGNLAFGNIQIGGTFTASLVIANQGSTTLTVSGMTGPVGYSADWTNGTISAGGQQIVTIRFSPTELRAYTGTLTVNADHTSGTNTIPISGTGVAPPRPNFFRAGTGDQVFDMPLDVQRVRIIGVYAGNSSNFVVRIGGRLIVNELLGTGWPMTRYDGTLLTGGGGVVSITLSSGVQWSMEEVR